MTIILSLFIAAHIFCATNTQPLSSEILETHHQSYRQLLPNGEPVTWYITESFPDTLEDYEPGMHIFLSPPDKAYDISEAYTKDKYTKVLEVFRAVYKTESSEQVARVKSQTIHNGWFHDNLIILTNLVWRRGLNQSLMTSNKHLSASACALEELDLTLLKDPSERRARVCYPFPYPTNTSIWRKPYLGLLFKAPHTLVLQLASDQAIPPMSTIELFKEDD